MSEPRQFGAASLALAFLAGTAAGVGLAWLVSRRVGEGPGAEAWTREARERAARFAGGVREACARAGEAARQAFSEAMREPGDGGES